MPLDFGRVHDGEIAVAVVVGTLIKRVAEVVVFFQRLCKRIVVQLGDISLYPRRVKDGHLVVAVGVTDQLCSAFAGIALVAGHSVPRVTKSAEIAPPRVGQVVERAGLCVIDAVTALERLAVFV